MKTPLISNHAAMYCKTPRRVTKAELINALHQSHCQLVAAQYNNLPGCLDHKPAIAEINRLMSRAGHVGFTH